MILIAYHIVKIGLQHFTKQRCLLQKSKYLLIRKAIQYEGRQYYRSKGLDCTHRKDRILHSYTAPLKLLRFIDLLNQKKNFETQNVGKINKILFV